MVQALGFLENQSSAIISWRSPESTGVHTLVGVGSEFHLLGPELDVVATAHGGDGRINRLVSLSSSSGYFSDSHGNVGFVALSSTNRGEIGRVDLVASSATDNGVCIDSDIHRSGHLAACLFNTNSGGFFNLLDTQRNSVLGNIPLGETGTPNAIRIVDSSHVAVGSLICSIFDVRTSQSKKGIPTRVLQTDGAWGGRSFTAIESDGSHTVIAGDSAGGLWLWDMRSDGPVKSVHAHSGAVLAIHLANGIVGSTSTDNSVSLWTVAEPNVSSNEGIRSAPTRKKHRKLLLDLGASDMGGKLKRLAVEGNGAALGICVEDYPSNDRLVSYVTDTGVVGLAHISEWQ